MSNEALVQEFRASPWLLVPAAALVALAISWIASIVLTFGNIPAGAGGFRLRLLTLFDPASGSVLAGLARSGNLGWALVLLVALAIAASGERSLMGGRVLWTWLRDALVVAAAVVGGAAVIAFILALTYLGVHPDAGLAAMLRYLAVWPVAAATIWWGVALGTPYVQRVSGQVSNWSSRARRARTRRAGPARPGTAGPGADGQPTSTR